MLFRSIQLQAEIEGVIPDPEWKQRMIGERWFLGNTYHMGIGQGDILVTPIQIAQLVQGIANNGNLCKATLIKDTFDLGNVGLSSVGGIFGKSRCEEVGVLEENINLVLDGMLGACSAGGTGFPFFENNLFNGKFFSNEYWLINVLTLIVISFLPIFFSLCHMLIWLFL